MNQRRIAITADLVEIPGAEMPSAAIAAGLSRAGMTNFALFLARLPGRDCLFAFGCAADGLGGAAGFPVLESVVDGFGTLVWVEAEEIFRLAGAANPASRQESRCVATVTELRPEMESAYRALHANPWPAVIEQSRRAGIHDYSVFLQELDGRLFMFSHFLQTGDNRDRALADMARSAACRRWWKFTGACISPLPAAAAGQQWSEMKPCHMAKAKQ